MINYPSIVPGISREMRYKMYGRKWPIADKDHWCRPKEDINFNEGDIVFFTFDVYPYEITESGTYGILEVHGITGAGGLIYLSEEEFDKYFMKVLY